MSRLIPHLSVALGWSKVQAAPSCTVLLVLLQLMTGAVVSMTLTVWLHWALLPQASVAAQVRVAAKVLRSEERRVGKVLRCVMAMFVLPVTVEIGALKVMVATCCRV